MTVGGEAVNRWKRILHATDLSSASRPAFRRAVQLGRRHGAELIVIGASRRRGFRRLLFGSTADARIRRAPCPVLTIGVASGVRGRSGERPVQVVA
jgi:nucleotide-binding universal stress UspA family protein